MLQIVCVAGLCNFLECYCCAIFNELTKQKMSSLCLKCLCVSLHWITDTFSLERHFSAKLLLLLFKLKSTLKSNLSSSSSFVELPAAALLEFISTVV